MLQERAAGLGRGHALSSAHEQRRPQRLLHVSDARAGCGQREVCALRTARDAARLDYVAEQTEIGEVEAHGWLSFGFSEANLREIPIVRQVAEGHIRH